MRNKRRGTVCILCGVLLIAAAMALTGYNLWDEGRAARTASQALTQIQRELPPVQTPAAPDVPAETTAEAAIPNYILNPEMAMPEQTIDDLSYIGVLEIPALELTLPIISRWSDDNAKSAPCRYAGSAYTNDMVIAGHNYRSHFANLKSVPEGSSVYFTDMDGNRFEYKVVLVETLHATDVEEMLSGGWDLSLFTCTMSGQYRATIRCERTA